ncbi:SLC45 family MFS transporter [Sphingomonas ginsenosidivorax]|uniref:SLC45 family MFS transporter n=1 Tax=Sphingomonas ginsenosidivorax TaxID=862135 RepID=A0A5C6UBY5_9SPHN|nr:MFS transporter [Sphingomonas ginsenosidivorax]TXC70337.1 SLC45 family MFS transporter [Sphingomonas ginsenosidivorax]
MNLGFLGLQFSFGLQQGNMAPIYGYLGASEAALPLLQLAGPVTGLLVQPLIGAMSDRTDSRWGRRTPYFLLGALLCAAGLFFMPLSSSLLMAVSILWILDAGNNITMEPYRAYVADRLNADQHQIGFLTQSAFTGLAQMFAFLTPSLLVWAGMNQDWVDTHNIPYTARVAFMVGAVLSFSTILWSIRRVPELPLSAEDKARIATTPKDFGAVLREIGSAIRAMPVAMRKLALMSLFQWYAMAAYWAYVIYSIGRSVYHTSLPTSSGFHSAVLANGEMAAFYNGVAFVAAFAMVPLAKRFGAASLHAGCLVLAGLGMLWLPHVADKWMLFLPAIGIGIGWGSMMGNPYVILAGSIPAERTGVYMGIFNMMIVIPMLIFSGTMWLFYDRLLGGDPRNVLTLCGVLMFAAAAAVWSVRERDAQGLSVGVGA